jgi:hypothetical protein
VKKKMMVELVFDGVPGGYEPTRLFLHRQGFSRAIAESPFTNEIAEARLFKEPSDALAFAASCEMMFGVEGAEWIAVIYPIH